MSAGPHRLRGRARHWLVRDGWTAASLITGWGGNRWPPAARLGTSLRLSQGSRDSKCKGPEAARGTRASSFMPWPRGPALRRACAWVHDLPLWAGNSLVFEQGVWRFCPPLGPVNSVAGARGMSNDVGLWGVGGDLGFYSQRGREAEALDRAGPAGILIGSVLLPCGAQAPKKLVKECAV